MIAIFLKIPSFEVISEMFLYCVKELSPMDTGGGLVEGINRKVFSGYYGWEYHQSIFNLLFNKSFNLLYGFNTCLFIHAHYFLFNALFWNANSSNSSLICVLLFYQGTISSWGIFLTLVITQIVVYILLNDALRNCYEFNLLYDLIELLC